MSPPNAESPSIYVVRGTEPALVDRALADLLRRLGAPPAAGAPSDGPEESLGGESGSATLSAGVEEHRVPAPPAGDEGVAGIVADALYTPGFLAERRVVVLRDAEKLDAAQSAELAGRMEAPFAPNVLVLAVVGKGPAAPLAKIVKARGVEIDTSLGTSRARSQWLGEQMHGAPVQLEPAARRLLEEHLGEDVSRLPALFEVLVAAYGEGSRLGPAELAPFLGEEGAGAPWDLTDAIDEGNIADAVAAAHRMLGSGGRHPFQVLATLHRHFASMLRLDGAPVTDAAQAASLLGMAAFPASKVWKQARRLGPIPAAQAVSLIANADLDLRGVVDWPGELVIEVLVARLARLSRSRGAQVQTGGRGR